LSRQKLRIHNTPVEKIASELRGEVGEAITSWILWRWLHAQQRGMQSEDLAADLANQELVFLQILAARINEDLVARLSELAERKIGRVNFYFAGEKLGALEAEVKAYSRFVNSKGFAEFRNYAISHKELTADWGDMKHHWLRPRVVVRAVAMALRLMKKIDRAVLGPASPFLWQEVRKRRYEFTAPPRVRYMMLPYMRLPDRVRLQVARAEEEEGIGGWKRVDTLIDGERASVLLNKKWGLISLGNQVLVLKSYPVQDLTSIQSNWPDVEGLEAKPGSEVTPDPEE